MTKDSLTLEEKELLQSVEKGEWKQIKNYSAEVKRLRSAAEATLKKEERITVRLTKGDLSGIRQKAANEGIPYQTLISSLVHKYVTGKIKV